MSYAAEELEKKRKLQTLNRKLGEMQELRSRADAYESLKAKWHESRERLKVSGNVFTAFFRGGLTRGVELTDEEVTLLEDWLKERAKAKRAEADKLENEIAGNVDTRGN